MMNEKEEKDQEKAQEKDQVSQLHEELLSQAKSEAEATYARVVEHMDNALSQLAKAKVQAMDLGVLLNIPTV